MPIRPFSTVPGSTVSLTDAVGVCVFDVCETAGLLAVLIVVPDIGEADVDCRILLRKRVLRPLDILCHVPPQAVRIDEIDLHTGRVEDLTGPILRFYPADG